MRLPDPCRRDSPAGSLRHLRCVPGLPHGVSLKPHRELRCSCGGLAGLAWPPHGVSAAPASTRASGSAPWGCFDLPVGLPAYAIRRQALLPCFLWPSPLPSCPSPRSCTRSHPLRTREPAGHSPVRARVRLGPPFPAGRVPTGLWVSALRAHCAALGPRAWRRVGPCMRPVVRHAFGRRRPALRVPGPRCVSGVPGGVRASSCRGRAGFRVRAVLRGPGAMRRGFGRLALPRRSTPRRLLRHVGTGRSPHVGS